MEIIESESKRGSVRGLVLRKNRSKVEEIGLIKSNRSEENEGSMEKDEGNILRCEMKGGEDKIELVLEKVVINEKEDLKELKRENRIKEMFMIIDNLEIDI